MKSLIDNYFADFRHGSGLILKTGSDLKSWIRTRNHGTNYLPFQLGPKQTHICNNSNFSKNILFVPWYFKVP